MRESALIKKKQQKMCLEGGKRMKAHEKAKRAHLFQVNSVGQTFVQHSNNGFLQKRQKKKETKAVVSSPTSKPLVEKTGNVQNPGETRKRTSGDFDVMGGGDDAPPPAIEPAGEVERPCSAGVCEQSLHLFLPHWCGV